jgi:hypothetical protein
MLCGPNQSDRYPLPIQEAVMKFPVYPTALLGVLALTPALWSQGSSQNVPSNLAEVRFGDGSLVRMTILQDNLEVMTKYGKLTIPVAEIRRVDFGLHLPEGVGRKIDDCIRLLGSETFRDRDEAARELVVLGSTAYPFLQRASRSPDLEVAQRVSHVIKKISDKVPVENIRTKEEDVILTKEFTVVGRIVSPTLRANSTHFGELNLKLSDLRTMHLRNSQTDLELTVDASRYGSNTDQWMDTGVTVDRSLRLVVTAEGQVDLWPMAPGQYMTTPKGYTTTGKGGTHMAGSLIGKIGETGKLFFVGERFDGSPGEEGRLFVHIVPSPWNNASSGSYRVRVHVDHLALSAK